MQISLGQSYLRTAGYSVENAEVKSERTRFATDAYLVETGID